MRGHVYYDKSHLFMELHIALARLFLSRDRAFPDKNSLVSQWYCRNACGICG